MTVVGASLFLDLLSPFENFESISLQVKSAACQRLMMGKSHPELKKRKEMEQCANRMDISTDSNKLRPVDGSMARFSVIVMASNSATTQPEPAPGFTNFERLEVCVVEGTLVHSVFPSQPSEGSTSRNDAPDHVDG